MLTVTRNGGEAAAEVASFRAIYDRHSTPVYRFLRDLFGNDSSAEEATQETFVRAYRRLDTVREPERMLPWLFGIARNVFYEALREKKHRGTSVDEETLDAEVHPGPTPEVELLTAEADEVLAAALARLSPDRKAALSMLIDHNLSYGEIAETMGWSLAKTKVEIHRARQVMRGVVAKYLGGDR